VKKKIIKKKKKVAKKKDLNTINYFNSTINDEDLMKSKINKIDLENKLITEIKKVNVSTEVKSNDKNLKEMNKNKNRKSLKPSESKKDKLNYNLNFSSLNNLANKNAIINNINSSREKSKKEIDENNKNDNEELLKINSNRKEPEIIFSNSGKKKCE